MNAIASGDQVEAFVPVEFACGFCHEANTIPHTCTRSDLMGLSDGLRIGIETDDFALGKRLRNCNTNTPDAATDIKHAAAVFKSLNDIRKLCEPIAAKALLVLTAVDHIKGDNTFRTEIFESHTATCAECISNFWSNAEQNWGEVEQPAHEMVCAIGGNKIGVLFGQQICLCRRVLVKIACGRHAV